MNGAAEAAAVPERLSPLDVSFLYLEDSGPPMHVGGLAVLDPPAGGFDPERLLGTIERRLHLVPRYRQQIRRVPGHLAAPVWVDDEDFELSHHVHRVTLPAPGDDAALRELVARVLARPLDRRRPLWEMYLVEGLTDGRVALIYKTHHAMVDGISAVDIGQVILDPDPGGPAADPDGVPLWVPRPAPSDGDLVSEALRELMARPGAVLETARLAADDLRAAGGRLARAAEGLLSAARVAVRPAPDSPLNRPLGPDRRFATACADLAQFRAVRARVDATVNDVALATVAGALREWLLSRGEVVAPATAVRALVPVSVRTDDQVGRLGNRVSTFLVDLPVGEPNPVVRLTQIAYAMRAHKESGQSVAASAIVAASGFAPPTLHALGARAAGTFSRRLFNLVVSNVPGPQVPLYAAGARLREVFPIVPLASGQALSIGLTSYAGGVYFGLYADRVAMPDLDELAVLIEQSLAELVATAGAAPSVAGTGVRHGTP